MNRLMKIASARSPAPFPGAGLARSLAIWLSSSLVLSSLLAGCEEAEQVRFENSGTTVPGEIWKPPASAATPAVIFVQGAKAATRKDIRPLAKQLTEQGIAALLYDGRAAGTSGDSNHPADFQTLATDANAAARYLLQRPDIRHENIGFAGFDQGGWIAPLAASTTSEIAFVILISAPLRSPRAQLGEQATQAWHDSEYDPLPVLRALRPPLLAIWGEKDQSLPITESVALLDSLMRAAGKKDFAVRVLPDAEHELYTKPYHDSPLPLLQNLPLSPRFDAEALEAMVYWIKVVAPLHQAQ